MCRSTKSTNNICNVRACTIHLKPHTTNNFSILGLCKRRPFIFIFLICMWSSHKVTIKMIEFFKYFLHIMWLGKYNPFSIFMIFIPKIAFATPKSLISKFEDKRSLVFFTTFISVPKINILSTYRHIIIPLSPENLLYTHLSDLFKTTPLEIKLLSKFSFHYLGACFKSYDDFLSLHTLFSCPWTSKPSDWSM